MKAALLLLTLLVTGCAGSPLAPSVATSGRALSYPAELQSVMAALDADPWIHPLIGEPMGPWFRRYVDDIRMDASLATTIGATAQLEDRLILWNPRVTTAQFGDAPLVAKLLHEARHFQGYPHTCGKAQSKIQGDRTMEEGGAFAVEILYLEHTQQLEAAAITRRDYIGCR